MNVCDVQFKLRKRTFKNSIEVEIKTNKCHRINDLEILRKGNPEVFARRDFEVCRELASKV